MVRDCVPFLGLSGVILSGFSIGLFVVFQDIIEHVNSIDRENNDEEVDDEVFKKITDSFGTPLKAILTLFCAMIGTFDIEVQQSLQLELKLS